MQYTTRQTLTAIADLMCDGELGTPIDDLGEYDRACIEITQSLLGITEDSEVRDVVKKFLDVLAGRL